MRQVIIYPGEDGFWVAECPSLPGCVSQGENRAAAIKNIREAMDGHATALQEDGLPVPKEHFDTLLLAVRASCRRFPGRMSSAFKKHGFQVWRPHGSHMPCGGTPLLPGPSCPTTDNSTGALGAPFSAQPT